MEPALIKFIGGAFVMLFFVAMIILWHEGILRFPSKKDKPEKIPKEGKGIDFNDDEKDLISSVIGKEVQYANPSFIRSLIFYSVRHTDKIDNKMIECASIRFRFQMLLFANGTKQLLIHSESNFGSPTWTGSQMLYNYDIVYNEFRCSIDEFKQTWDNIIHTFFVVDITSDELSDRVRDGSMSYWTEKEHGHLI